MHLNKVFHFLIFLVIVANSLIINKWEGALDHYYLVRGIQIYLKKNLKKRKEKLVDRLLNMQNICVSKFMYFKCC
jgi:hypothetical protein